MNTSGITPMEFNCLILPDPVEEKTAGGLILSDETKDREKHAATKGVLVAMSPLAFNADVWPADVPRPNPGTRVMVTKHSGTFAKGVDGKEYRIVKDKDVVAMIEDQR